MDRKKGDERMIEIKGVSKIFDLKRTKTAAADQIHAVDDVTLTIEDGEIFGIIGHSGAGKSTLIRMINQLERQTSGDIVIDGLRMGELKGKELRRRRMKMGMIFQHFNLLWSRTIEDNIALPLEIAGVPKQKRNERVRELIRLVGLEGREKAYPSELSGGQKQRVGIARALANEPDILLCDEATSALDPETTQSILDLLVEINRSLKLTIVLITHQMEVVQKICHRIAVMSEGKIVEMGSTQDVFLNPQHEVTKRFIQDVTDTDDEDLIRMDLQRYYPNARLVRLYFTPDISNRPILMRVAKETDLEVSIVNSQITNSIMGPMGNMFITVEHEKDEEFTAFCRRLEEEGVKVEVIQ